MIAIIGIHEKKKRTRFNLKLTLNLKTALNDLTASQKDPEGVLNIFIVMLF